MNYILLKLANDEGPDGCTILGLMKVDVQTHKEPYEKYGEEWVPLDVSDESYNDLLDPLPINEYLTLDEVAKLTDLSELQETWSE